MVNDQQFNVAEQWINSQLHFYRKNNLVYAATLKCACTFYQDVLGRHNQWEKIKFNNIDWNVDHVFGFITEPLTRYLKGLVEDLLGGVLVMPDNIETLFQPGSMVLSFHSLPISQLYKKYMYQIDWIPLDTDVPSEILVEKLFQHYNLTVSWPNNSDRNISTKGKVDLFNKVKNHIGLGNNVYYRVLSTDIDFYNLVRSRFNTHENSWDKISWLTQPTNILLK